MRTAGRRRVVHHRVAALTRRTLRRAAGAAMGPTHLRVVQIHRVAAQTLAPTPTTDVRAPARLSRGQGVLEQFAAATDGRVLCVAVCSQSPVLTVRCAFVCVCARVC